MDKTETFLDVSIWREQNGDGYFETYQVPQRANQTILDVVAWVQQQADPTLSYRFACRVGMCGSCAMMVNGASRWTCRAHVLKVAEGASLKIAPLRKLPMIKDLVNVMDSFFNNWVTADAVFELSKIRDCLVATIMPNNAMRIVAQEAIESINCALMRDAIFVAQQGP